LAPYSVKNLLEDLGTQPFSISIDSSNHKEEKLFPFVVRFFSARKGIQVRLLDLETLPGESSILVFEWIKGMVRKHDLDFHNLSAFCADNAPVNFGKPDQKERGPGEDEPQNIFYKIQSECPYVIPIGCCAHVLHNSAKHAANNLSIDIESIAFKLASYFKGSTKRHVEFEDLCDLCEVCFVCNFNLII
jgi:hypothetical protein